MIIYFNLFYYGQGLRGGVILRRGGVVWRPDGVILRPDILSGLVRGNP